MCTFGSAEDSVRNGVDRSDSVKLGVVRSAYVPFILLYQLSSDPSERSGTCTEVDTESSRCYHKGMVKKGTQMQIDRKAELRAETEAAVAAFIARGGVVTEVKARKTPKTATAKGKNRGAFNPSKIFAVGA